MFILTQWFHYVCRSHEQGRHLSSQGEALPPLRDFQKAPHKKVQYVENNRPKKARYEIIIIDTGN